MVTHKLTSIATKTNVNISHIIQIFLKLARIEQESLDRIPEKSTVAMFYNLSGLPNVYHFFFFY